MQRWTVSLSIISASMASDGGAAYVKEIHHAYGLMYDHQTERRFSEFRRLQHQTERGPRKGILPGPVGQSSHE